MNALLVYASKSGGTQSCAEKMKEELSSLSIDLVNIRDAKKLNLASYDAVIFGTPLYMGKADRKMKKFMAQHESALAKKKLHFFVCGLARGEDGIAIFRKDVESPLLDQAVQIRQLGCEIYLARLNFFYRSIIQKIIEDKNPELGFDEEELQNFIDTLAQSA